MADNESGMPRVGVAALHTFCTEVFEKLGVPSEDAAITSEVLISADLRGVESHGVARLPRYVDGIRDGVMVPRPNVQVVQETVSTAVLDANNGLGQPPSVRAMELAIQKARKAGIGFVTVRNSNHYGIAGYYAMMALKHDMIGISLTNSDTLVVPTFGRKAMLGTNPISVAVPGGRELPYVLDMATSVVPRGKLEVYDRLGKKMPLGWATDSTGQSTDDAGLVLKILKYKEGLLGGILPLGGVGELHSGYKGYGLAMLVDIFSGVLAGTAYSTLTYPTGPRGEKLPSRIGHFFGAVRVDAFRPLPEFKADMDNFIDLLKSSPKAEGEGRIYIPGEKEFEREVERRRDGIPLHPKVVANMKRIGEELSVKWLGLQE
jgi:L-2-hydroxycarboxylate dehydrogenase (NAD+)